MTWTRFVEWWRSPSPRLVASLAVLTAGGWTLAASLASPSLAAEVHPDAPVVAEFVRALAGLNRWVVYAWAGLLAAFSIWLYLAARTME